MEFKYERPSDALSDGLLIGVFNEFLIFNTVKGSKKAKEIHIRKKLQNPP
jgi:hypothetical protein